MKPPVQLVVGRYGLKFLVLDARRLRVDVLVIVLVVSLHFFFQKMLDERRLDRLIKFVSHIENIRGSHEASSLAAECTCRLQRLLVTEDGAVIANPLILRYLISNTGPITLLVRAILTTFTNHDEVVVLGVADGARQVVFEMLRLVAK